MLGVAIEKALEINSYLKLYIEALNNDFLSP